MPNLCVEELTQKTFEFLPFCESFVYRWISWIQLEPVKHD